MSARREMIIWMFLITTIFTLRMPELDAFTTVDESTWLMRSANFYYALGQRDFEKTVYAYHPAVTTMWIGASAMILDFPEYRGFGQGYFEKEWQFSNFLIEHGYHPLQMLKSSRAIQVGINAFLFGMIYLLKRRILGWWPAFVGVLFLSLDPFLLGHTRILAHEGMMSLLLLVSILAFLNYLLNSHRWLYIILSAIAAALAILTKSSATIVLFFVGLICWVETFRGSNRRSGRWAGLVWQQGKRYAGGWIIWLVVFLLAFVSFWPGMWVNPRPMLFEVYGNAFSYAVQGHNLDIVETQDSSPFKLNETGFRKYTQDILWRTTPVLWIGLIFAAVFMFSNKTLYTLNTKRVILTLLCFGLLFFLMMSIARGRRAYHYIMAAHTSLSLISGLGIVYGISWMSQRLSGRARLTIPAFVFIGLGILQITSLLHYFPYYLNYSNPVLESIEDGMQTPVSGYGEGLELAAAYLAKKPGAEKMTVMSWWGIGPFSFYFPGQTENIFPASEWSPAMVERLEMSDYLVIYYDHQLKRNIPAKLLRDIAAVQPDHSIRINGVEYVRIYRVSELPESVFIPDVQGIP